MKKLLITLIATAAFAIPFLSMHAPEEEVYDGPDYYRGCVASAHQATAHGFETDLEANLAVCDKLRLAE
jgi:hypothetical protein